MIPRIIHYCWFGGNPLPSSAEKYIESWKEYLPEYEVIEWNESNFDVNAIPYTKEAYMSKKYAFVSDYARFFILHKFGGLYFDTDVEIIRPLDDIIRRGPFMGIESDDANQITVAPGLCMGAEPGNKLIERLLEIYTQMHFLDNDGKLILKNIVEITTDLLIERGLHNINEIQQCEGFYIYPKDYFCPIDYNTRKLEITENTRTIHHYAESWIPKSVRVKNAISRILGKRFMGYLVAVKKYFK